MERYEFWGFRRRFCRESLKGRVWNWRRSFRVYVGVERLEMMLLWMVKMVVVVVCGKRFGESWRREVVKEKLWEWRVVVVVGEMVWFGERKKVVVGGGDDGIVMRVRMSDIVK